MVGREHAVHQVRRALGHAPPAAARVEATAPAGERHEPLEGTVGAAYAVEAVRCTPRGAQRQGGDAESASAPDAVTTSMCSAR
jgi:hypothetical protein